MKKILFALVAVAALVFGFASPAEAARASELVSVSIVDTTTINITVTNTSTETIKVVGIYDAKSADQWSSRSDTLLPGQKVIWTYTDNGVGTFTIKLVDGTQVGQAIYRAKI